MASSEANYIENVPKNSKEIEVTSVLNPYYIRVKDKQFNHSKKDLINKKLYKLVKPIIDQPSKVPYKPAVGDDVIVTVHYRWNDKIDLPDQFCRGVVMDTTPNTSDVFFLDEGITMNVPTESLIKYSRDLVPVEALTYTVGIYNILPACVSKEFHITKEWPKTTTDFVKQLIQVSSKIYFKAAAYDRQKNNYYGDLFLVLQNENVCLSKVLLHCHLAVLLNDNLLHSICDNVSEETMIPLRLKQKESPSNQNSLLNQNYLSQRSTNDFLLYDENKSKFNKKQSKEKILIKGKFSLKPLVHIEDSGFSTTVHETLKNQGVRSLKEIQCYMWPAVKSGNNLVTIGSKSSGKTTGYVVPIISKIVELEEYILRRQKNNIETKPVALILCTSVNKCLDVATKCNELLYYRKNIKTFNGHNGVDDKYTMIQICNKFHILITTVPFLTRTLENFSNKLILSELSYLVLDGADVLLNQYFNEIMSLIKKYKIINLNNESNVQDGPMQIITVSETWTDQIRSFIDCHVQDPCIFIASYIEAAAYCRVQGRMLIRHSEKKKEEILASVSDYTKVKTMIFCLDSKEAVELNDYLRSKSVVTLLAHENLSITQIQEIRDDWTQYLPGMYPVLICTDDIVEELEISDIELLIHYSVTNTSKTQFNRRFSVLMDNWQRDMKQYPCRVLILFDETKENAHFKGVVDILKRLKVKLPDDWSIISEGLDVANNISKKNFPLCDSYKLFGKCEMNSCPYRHRIVTDVDKPLLHLDISIGDEIKFQILHTHNASHFTVRLYECTNKITGKKTTYSYNILTLSMQMNKYYMKADNRRTLNNINVGTICVFRFDQKYFRVQILNIVESDVRTNKPKYVRLRCIDDGIIFEKSPVFELLEMPEEFLNFNLPVVDIYLMGLTPPDGEFRWSNAANDETNNWVKENDKAFAYTKVLLQIGNSIWTDSLVFRTKISGLPDLISSSINSILKSKKHAVKNESHESFLSDLCESGLTANNNDFNVIESE